MSDTDVAPVTKAPTPYAAPLRLVAVGLLRVVSLGLAALADQMEERKD